MSRHPPSRQLAACLVAALCLGAAPPARPDAATRGRIVADRKRGGALSPEGVPWFDRTLPDKMDAMGYPESVLYHIRPWADLKRLRIPGELSQEAVEQQFTAMEFDELREFYFRPKPDVRKQPGKDFGLNLSGVTGMLMLPNSFVLPEGQWAVGISYVPEKIDPFGFPSVYGPYESDALRLHVNHGFKKGFELGLTAHYRDTDVTYIDQGGGAQRLQDDFLVGGLSFKGVIPAHDVWMSAGFSLEYFDDSDRSLMDLRTYDWISNAFFTVSSGGRRWDGTMAIKYIKYATDGRQPPVGNVGGAPGFSPESSWTQIGLGFEYGKWNGWSLLFEGTDRHRIDFFGVKEKDVNLGIKYKGEDFELKAGALKVNDSETDQFSLTATLRFR